MTSEKPYRSRRTTHGREMAGARALWRATGMQTDDFQKPIIAIANSFTQFVPGHVHLQSLGQLVKQSIDAEGGYGVEFNTIAVDDGIAMGHGGMLYSLPSRELIADSVEYMVEAHVADALVCISNCDKITPGMLMAAMRLNIPTIFVSGGPMEAGESASAAKLDLVDAIIAGVDASVSEEDLQDLEENACPTCGSCSGMFTANSMNCLNEAFGLALPGNGTLLATHATRKSLFEEAGRLIVSLAKRYYADGDSSVLPRNIATFDAFENAMTLDIAMGGSTNTVLHILAIAHEAEVPFTMKDIDRLSRKTPTLSKVAPSSHYHIEDVHRAGGIPAILIELMRGGLIHPDVATVHSPHLGKFLESFDIASKTTHPSIKKFFRAAPGGVRSKHAFSQENYYNGLDVDRQSGCIRSVEYAYSQDGGLCVLYGNLAEKGAIVKTAGVPLEIQIFTGKARVFESQDDACDAILEDRIQPEDVLVIRYEGPRGGPGMQEMLYPTSFLKSKGLGPQCALITDGRFSGGTSGLSIGHISPEAAAKGMIGLVEEGDVIEINIHERRLSLKVDPSTLASRRQQKETQGQSAWIPKRERKVSKALQAYGLMASSAAEGAVRQIEALVPTLRNS